MIEIEAVPSAPPEDPERRGDQAEPASPEPEGGEPEPVPPGPDDRTPDPTPPESEVEAAAVAKEQEGASSSTYVHGDSIHADGDVRITSIRIERSAAVDDLRGLFGASTNRESVEVEVEDLIAPPDADKHFEALAEEFLLVLASTGQTGLSTAVRLRCKSFAADRDLPARMSLSTSVDELKQELKGFETPTVLVLDASQNPGLEEALATAAEQLRAMLKKQECHLVVAVETEFRREFKRHLPDSVFDLERTDPDRVFTHHFKRSDAEFAHILQSEYFNDTLRTAWPPLARSLTDILNNASVDMTLEDFQEQLKHRVEDASATIRDLLERRLDAQGKAVLVAAAALERLPTRAIALAAEEFLWMSSEEGTPVETLGEYGILQKLELIRQEFYIEGSNFKNPDLGDGVLLHVWEQYPAWQVPLRKWLVRLLLEPGYLEWTELTRLPRRLVKLASAAGNGAMLTGQVEVMIVSRSPVIRSLASAVLLGGALDETIGASVRGRIYEWSRSESFEKQRAALEACADTDYLVRFPRNALFRLRQLARSKNEEVSEAAFEAIIDSSAHMHLAELLLHFRFWLLGADQFETPMIPRLLDRICVKEEVVEELRRNPRLLLDDPIGTTASFWRLLLHFADPASVRLAVRAWLSAATDIAPADGERMIAIVVETAAEDYGSIGQLAQAAKSLMLDGSGLPERTRELSRTMLDRVFEIEVPLP